jgi:hypothetical protein
LTAAVEAAVASAAGARLDDSVPDVLATFDDVSPELLHARLLLQRVDRKHVMHRQALDALLAGLRADYRILRSERALAASYRTRYFDTPDRRSYDDHRRDRRPRYKVRVRHHLDRALTFLEVKCKGRDGRTSKARLDRPYGRESLDVDAERFIDEHCPFGASRLVPAVSIEFRRATLVGVDVDERITIDWDLRMSEGLRSDRLAQVVIVEIKQGRYSNRTPAVGALRALGVRERGISKYCVSVSKLTAVRSNVFKPVLRAMEQLSA